ncbi:hypothetical protein ARMGADRAFT_1166805 [Armillaria gallica]|uniref:F-box domain-containing protein n=1 Tax=Armillaria gallica TaxID=47427 RepID=A0A2H3DPY2_ARMGA|nr:hypothetical protein ARMGADRAFT_1166805 [Armillaria gallica]
MDESQQSGEMVVPIPPSPPSSNTFGGPVKDPFYFYHWESQCRSPLRALELGFVTRADNLSIILEDVSLPNLEILRVVESCHDLPEVLVPIVSNLTALTLVNNWSFLDTDMLENAPGLQSFAVREVYGKKRPSRVSEALLHRLAQETFLTNLQTIAFVVIGTINEESLMRMIAERAEGDRRVTPQTDADESYPLV